MRSSAWDERYAAAAASESTVWSREPNAFVAQTVADWHPGTAVDLGCGEGRNALWLGQRGWQVIGVDFSAIGLDIARERATMLGVEAEWVQADVTAWVSPTKVDLVVIAYLQLPRAELRAVIAAAAAALEPGGSIVLVGHAIDNLTRGTGGPQDAAVLHHLDDLRAAAGALEIQRCEHVTRRVGDRDAIDAVLVASKAA